MDQIPTWCAATENNNYWRDDDVDLSAEQNTCRSDLQAMLATVASSLRVGQILLAVVANLIGTDIVAIRQCCSLSSLLLRTSKQISTARVVWKINF